MEICDWIIQNNQLIPRILFTDKAMFTRDGIMNCRNSHSWALENPDETHLQHRFSVIWCRITDDQLTELFVFEHSLTAKTYLNFLEVHLPELLEDVSLEVR